MTIPWRFVVSWLKPAQSVGMNALCLWLENVAKFVQMGRLGLSGFRGEPLPKITVRIKGPTDSHQVNKPIPSISFVHSAKSSNPDTAP